MKQISNKEYEKYQQYQTDKLHGRILTPDGLRIICAGLDNDPEKIGIHMLEMLAKFRNEGIIDCAKITSVSTPASTKRVSDDAFYGCTGLTSVAFFGDNAVIGDCLTKCPNIKTLTVGNGVKAISETYNDFEKLETISLNTNTVYRTNGGVFLTDNTTATKVIFTGTGTVKDLNFAHQPNINNVVIENGVKGIGAGAFQFWERVKAINIPPSVKTIGAEAFGNCKRLKTLIIGTGVTKLGKNGIRMQKAQDNHRQIQGT